MEGYIHINTPTPTDTSYRLLPKYCSKFISTTFDTLQEAINYGIEHHKKGFRVFYQTCYKWYEPTNLELVKYGNIEKYIKEKDY